jgi:hypothetical protein
VELAGCADLCAMFGSGDQAQPLPMTWGAVAAPFSAEVGLRQVRAQQCQQRAVALGDVRRAHLVAVELQPDGPSVAGMALYEPSVIAPWRLARRYMSGRRFGALYLWAATPSQWSRGSLV